jgi:hypothetical protein
VWSAALNRSDYCINLRVWLTYGSYQDFLNRGLLLTRTLLNQGLQLAMLKSLLRKFYGRHHDAVNRYEHLCLKWPHICSTCRKYLSVELGTVYPFRVHLRVISKVRVARSLVFLCSALKEIKHWRSTFCELVGIIIFHLGFEEFFYY